MSEESLSKEQNSSILSNMPSITDNSDTEGATQVSDAVANAPAVAGPPSKHGFFSTHLAAQRQKVWWGYIQAYLIMCTGLLAICSIYWGSYYKRENRANNLAAHIYLWDGLNSTYLQDNGLEPYVAQALQSATELPELKDLLGWQIINDTSVTEEQVLKLIHEQHIWTAIFVYPNATESIHKALINGDANWTGNGLVYGAFEQATDYLSIATIVQPVFSVLAAAFQDLSTEMVFNPLLEAINSTSSGRSALSDLENNFESRLPVLTQPISLDVVDRLPLAEPLLIAPLQVGLIYLIILSFFQFNFFMPIHMIIQPRLKISHLIFYRFLSSQAGFFVISLFFCLVSLAFQVDTGVTFGKSGFLVFWMINFLAMSALGGATENVALIVFPVYPPMLGLWLLFWVIVNISPAFSPMSLTAKFFEYGYAFPVYNALQLIKVVLCDTTKRTMGRNFGILIAWIVINNALMPFCLKFAGARMQAKAIAEAKAKAEEDKALKV